MGFPVRSEGKKKSKKKSQKFQNAKFVSFEPQIRNPRFKAVRMRTNMPSFKKKIFGAKNEKWQGISCRIRGASPTFSESDLFRGEDGEYQRMYCAENVEAITKNF